MKWAWGELKNGGIRICEACGEVTLEDEMHLCSEGEQMSEFDSRIDTYDHILKVQRYLLVAVDHIMWRIPVHDISKLEGMEKEAFDIATPKLAETEYGSEEYRTALKEIRPAIQQHYSLNSHHPEHYENGIDGMNLFDLIEMLCDWKAASERVKQPRAEAVDGERSGESASIIHSLEHNAERFDISPQLLSILYNTVRKFMWA